jgi:prophage antirepressor-like protein
MKAEVIKHPDFQEIRTVTIKGEPWFVASDVCDILGIQNIRQNVASVLDDDEKGVCKIYTLGGNQEMSIVNESGLYALILRSRKPEAKKFRKWVTSEVLPSIRKHGFYVSETTTDVKVLKKLRRELGVQLMRYLPEGDRRRIATRHGLTLWDVNGIIRGYEDNNAVMDDLMKRAFVNREREGAAYSPARMIEVLDKLKTKS